MHKIGGRFLSLSLHGNGCGFVRSKVYEPFLTSARVTSAMEYLVPTDNMDADMLSQ